MTAAFTCVLRDLGSLGSLIWRLSANRFVRHNTAQPAQHSSTGPELMTPVPPTPPSLCPGFPLQRCNGPSQLRRGRFRQDKQTCHSLSRATSVEGRLALVTGHLPTTGQALDLPWKQQRLTQLHARPPPLS